MCLGKGREGGVTSRGTLKEPLDNVEMHCGCETSLFLIRVT